jgi:hypothetical protein
MKYYVTENRNLKVWTEKPDERDYITDTINEKVLSWRGAIDYAKAAEKWKKAFDKQDEILTSPELKEQLTPGQVIDGDSFKWNRAKTFDPGKYIKDKGFEVGCAECCNGDCDCEVGERCKFKGNRKGCTYCKGECFYRTENDVPKVAVPLDTAHKCQYCGAMTTQPDEQCWNNPKNHKYTEGEDDISGEFHEAQQRRPDTATEESNLREALENINHEDLLRVFKSVSLLDLSDCRFENGYEQQDIYINAYAGGRVVDGISFDGNVFKMMNNDGSMSLLNPQFSAYEALAARKALASEGDGWVRVEDGLPELKEDRRSGPCQVELENGEIMNGCYIFGTMGWCDRLGFSQPGNIKIIRWRPQPL